MASSSSPSVNRRLRRVLEAALTGDLSVFQNLRSSFPRGEGFAEAIMSTMDRNGLTALHLAVTAGRLQICRFLVENAKVDVNSRVFSTGQTPLHVAIVAKQIPVAVYLVEKGADPNVAAKFRGRTPFHLAVEKGTEELVELLISKGANVNAVGDYGTPLQYAAAKGMKNLVKLLLDNHADTGADTKYCGMKGMTPLGLAAAEGDTEVIKCLLSGGADPNVIDNLGMTPLEVAALRGNQKDVMVLFPVTSPIATISEWNIEEVMKHVQSEEAKGKRKEKLEEKLFLSKRKLEEEIGCGHSGCNQDKHLAHLNDGKLSSEAAEACISVWPRAFYRAGAEWVLSKESEAAIAALFRLSLDPQNKEIENTYRNAVTSEWDKLCFFPKHA